ncbi:MAG: hypothetical protein E7I03_24735, partial [Serratia liquefaciens]|nr:hypothetical protein [Serratia liquefaciens]
FCIAQIPRSMKYIYFTALKASNRPISSFSPFSWSFLKLFGSRLPKQLCVHQLQARLGSEVGASLSQVRDRPGMARQCHRREAGIGLKKRGNRTMGSAYGAGQRYG